MHACKEHARAEHTHNGHDQSLLSGSCDAPGSAWLAAGGPRLKAPRDAPWQHRAFVAAGGSKALRDQLQNAVAVKGQ
jgi:hypothetical protein